MFLFFAGRLKVHISSLSTDFYVSPLFDGSDNCLYLKIHQKGEKLTEGYD